MITEGMLTGKEVPPNRTAGTGSSVVTQPVQCYVAQPVTARQRLTVLGAIPGDRSRLPGHSGRRRCSPQSPARAAPVPRPELGARAPRIGLGSHGVHADAKSGPATVKQ